jgi:hypothetical protein
MNAILAALFLAQQSPCGPTGQVEKRIHDQYGESIVGAGITPGGILFTLANPETGTFTILLRRPDGMTCVLMGGTGWASQEPTKPGKSL